MKVLVSGILKKSHGQVVQAWIGYEENGTFSSQVEHDGVLDKNHRVSGVTFRGAFIAYHNFCTYYDLDVFSDDFVPTRLFLENLDTGSFVPDNFGSLALIANTPIRQNNPDGTISVEYEAGSKPMFLFRVTLTEGVPFTRMKRPPRTQGVAMRNCIS